MNKFDSYPLVILVVAELLFIIRGCNAVVCAVVAFLAISRHGKG